ncbi:hypothetical protein [Streptomyces formicae]|uniref:Uncharacterized protein n=1 Tax=Streptomyces formicae TaxID=1616117 RepID=A0A291QII3_9ACTN|nr:hypothetical protein [Streptomyces formicae]ATL31263.1 hypothetical protein KY5_6245 [Streptomyces formicae]
MFRIREQAHLPAHTIDTLAFAHRVRGGPFPTGCNLDNLVKENLGEIRRKLRFPTFAPGLRPGGMSGMSPERHDADPREDASLVARTWEAMVTTRTLAWGAGKPFWTHLDGDTRPGSAELVDEHIAELTGEQPQIEAAEWAARIREEGRIMRPTTPSINSLLLANLAAACIPAPEPVRIIADLLQTAGEIPSARVLQAEDLYMACQYLGTQQNLDVRHRSTTGKTLTKPLREPVAWALWQLAQPEWTAAQRHWREEARTTATGHVRLRELKKERERIRGRLAALVD